MKDNRMRNRVIPLIAAALLLAQSVEAETAQIGDNKGNIMAINSDGTLPVANVGTRVFYDAFETSFDTTVNWAAPVSAGGGIGEAWSAGQVTLGTGTTANGYASIVTQHAFAPVPPGHLEIVKAVKLPTTLPANTEAFWGIGTAALTPTAAAPVQEGCGFEIQAASTSALEKMYAVCFAGSTRNVIQDLSVATGNGAQPRDGLTHTYYIFFRGDFYYFAIDQLSNVVAIQRTGTMGPNINTQPVLVEAVAGTSNPVSSLTITVAAVWVGDTGRNGVQVCDSAHPWQCQAINASGGSAVAPTTGGSVTPGTAASQSDLSACIYNTTPPTVTNGQQVATQCDSSGNARSVIVPASSAAVGITPIVSAAAEATHILKASAGNLYSIYAVNLTATAGFLVVTNTTTAPVDGAIAPLDYCILPASGSCAISYDPGPPDVYATGMTAILTSAATPLTKTTGTITGIIHAQVQ